MPRQRKNGRHINYYIDREIYDRLERYAGDRGQSMTTAIERILREFLDRNEPESSEGGEGLLYCPHCGSLSDTRPCPVCGHSEMRRPRSDDFCFLAEKELPWAGMLSDVLDQNRIPCVTRNVLGAGLSAKLGTAMERVRFYVPYGQYPAAREWEQSLFAAEPVSDE